MKSRANFERRQQSIQARLDPSWQPELEKPVLGGGNVQYQVSARVEAIACGGLGMLQTVVDAVGLREQIDGSLHLLRRHLPYHESDHVLSLAYRRGVSQRAWRAATAGPDDGGGLLATIRFGKRADADGGGQPVAVECLASAATG
jgi:hypothetical protein